MSKIWVGGIRKTGLKTIMVFALCVGMMSLLAAFANAELVAVSQLGYHPDGFKQAVAYTNAANGSFSLKNAVTNATVVTLPLQKARDYNDAPVECQGNNPCLVGDFSGFASEGNYYIQTSLGGASPIFTINRSVYEDTAPIYLEFFNALQQQNSSYHADLHTGYDPSFPAMADGSFLLEADQAAVTLARLASAYRRNPALFSSDRYAMSGAGKPDMLEYIRSYVQYLKGLQGAVALERTDGTGFRTGWTLAVHNVFVPGPTNLTNMSVYSPGNPPSSFAVVPVKSLCGEDDGSAAWQQCINDAERYYKCKRDETCINASYVDKTAVIFHNGNYAVAKGWGPDFSCRVDVDLANGGFNGVYNPCMIFYGISNRKYTTETLFAFLMAIPAVHDYDADEGKALFNRSLGTYRYIKDRYRQFNTTAEDTPYWGASLFLLYDYTGNVTYLQEAHSVRNFVSQVFVSDHTRGNEYYWHEYIKHKDDLQALNLEYPVSNTDPREFFRGKLFYDYKDAGMDKAISRTGERVYQFDPNIQFMNSRFMLAEAVLAAKTTEMYPDDVAESFIPAIADAQLAWLAGMNGVQEGTGINAPIVSKSFIFGIGNFPSEFHSSLLQKHYREPSNGLFEGLHTPIYQFQNASGAFIFFDGAYNMLGHLFGSSGNSYNNEPTTPMFVTNQTFKNGMKYIPGWINGAFDIFADNDIILNYADDADIYEFTESTNELVATALELYAFSDGRYNNRQPHAPLQFRNESGTLPPSAPQPTNSTPTNATPAAPTNNTASPGTCFNNVQAIPANCTGGSIVTDAYNGCRTIQCANGADSMQILACDKPSSSAPDYFEMYLQGKTGSSVSDVCIGSTCIKNLGYVKSGNYPICTGNATSVNNTPTSPPLPPPPANSTNSTPTNITPGNTSSNSTPANTTCYNNIQYMPPECSGGAITQDILGGCRSITCSSASGSLTVQACDKPGSYNAQYFEMYKQAQTDPAISLCLGPFCIKDDGYVKSTDYPVCFGNASSSTAPLSNATNPTPPTNDTPTNITPSNGTLAVSLSIAPWYPQNRSYVFVCGTSGFSPTSYDWFFGDGSKQLASANRDVYYTYAPGSYSVSCTARQGTTAMNDTLPIVVS
ncbi:hypothetical protein HYV81_03155 [Candidatus Woesearchaeota archaeon]|nr:hypothetical protein [Candidatus Woesearchaeota archaeon]